MTSPRQALYERLPEIYRIKDQAQDPPDQLKAYLGVLDEVMAGIRDNIEALYHDHFIETCDAWVVPYIADLLGTSHLSGDPWTLRADTARTVFHRRRKGTLGAIESLAYGLTGWAAQAVELRERMAWNQHLNHQRPDRGGRPPLSLRTDISSAVRGGTVTLRDPAALTFLDGPFDPFAHLADFRPSDVGVPRYNLHKLAVFLWRLQDYQVPVADPGLVESLDVAGPGPGEAAAVVRAILHPQADPMVLFNTHRFRADDEPPELSRPDEVPGPMPWPRLTQDAPHGNPAAYVRVDHYAAPLPAAPGADSPGLVLHIPEGLAPVGGWRFRGANLCAWESGLVPPLQTHEIAIDPERGRVLFGVADRVAEGDPLAAGLFATYTYGFSGPSGAHPVVRPATPNELDGVPATVVQVTRDVSPNPLQDALTDLHTQAAPLIIEIGDSATYRLDLSTLSGVENQGGVLSLRLNRSLWIRARAGERPVIVLEQPLRFRPHDVLGPGADDIVAGLQVRLEGLLLTWNRGSADFAAAHTALIERAALNRLHLSQCTLDPGGASLLDGTADGTRQASRPASSLRNTYGFANAAERDAFTQVPQLQVERCIVGAVLAEDGYVLDLIDSVVDAGSGIEESSPDLAIGSPVPPGTAPGPTLTFDGATCFGAVRVMRASGRSGLWLHDFRAHDNQSGCIDHSAFGGDDNRLPPNHACVFDADLGFTSEWFGQAGYAQLRQRSDRRVLMGGPEHDEMGAFGYLRNAHKRKNMNIRFREFMPVGMSPVLIPVT